MASASASGSNIAALSENIERRPPGSRDPAWKHGYYGPVPGSVICTWCKKKISGGINRLKYHLVGIPCPDSKACPIAPAEVRREMEALRAALDEKKLERAKTQAAIAPNLTEDSDVNMQGIVGSSRGSRICTPSTSSTSSTSSKFQFFVPRNVQGSQPSLEGTGWNKEVHKEADKACANFWFYNNLPFNVARSPYWECLVTALTVAGKGYKAPSPRDISGRLLEMLL